MYLAIDAEHSVPVFLHFIPVQPDTLGIVSRVAHRRAQYALKGEAERVHNYGHYIYIYSTNTVPSHREGGF